MRRGAHWPESRTPSIMAPGLDAVSGRSYHQASQTPGALGGRRAVDRWFTSGLIDGSNISRMEVTVGGGSWRLIAVTARVRVAPTGDSISIDMLADGVSIFESGQTLTIAAGATEATGGVLKASHIYLLGTVFSTSHSSSASPLGQDLTTELHYRVMPVAQ